jgi:leucyl-tRNA synthetase
LNEIYAGAGHLMNSGEFSGMDSETAKWEIVKFVHGERKTQYRLRDWLISRQRYWGPPIPMIFCAACAKAEKGEHADMPGWYAVPESELPVKLPHLKDFRPKGTGASPLASSKSFYETKCPACGAAARRETDVSDTFLDSAWYYLRYLSPDDENQPFNKTRVKKWLPVPMYIGGAEHAVLHLLYVRFAAMALHDWGMIDFEEPMAEFRAHGLIIKDGTKMSKSKGNIINPDEYITKFGADALRMYLMFLAPFEQGGDFRDGGILGVDRFLNRMWRYFEAHTAFLKKNHGNTTTTEPVISDPSMERLLHQSIKKVTDDIAALKYNTAISQLMILLNGLDEETPAGGAFRGFALSVADHENILKLCAPFAPHITEEIWHENFIKKESIHVSLWPAYDPALIKEDTVTLVVQVNGKVRDTIIADASIDESAAKELALQSEKVKVALAGQEPKRVIYVAKKLINIVI